MEETADNCKNRDTPQQVNWIHWWNENQWRSLGCHEYKVEHTERSWAGLTDVCTDYIKITNWILNRLVSTIDKTTSGICAWETKNIKSSKCVWKKPCKNKKMFHFLSSFIFFLSNIILNILELLIELENYSLSSLNKSMWNHDKSLSSITNLAQIRLPSLGGCCWVMCVHWILQTFNILFLSTLTDLQDSASVSQQQFICCRSDVIFRPVLQKLTDHTWRRRLPRYGLCNTSTLLHVAPY